MSMTSEVYVHLCSFERWSPSEKSTIFGVLVIIKDLKIFKNMTHPKILILYEFMNKHGPVFKMYSSVALHFPSYPINFFEAIQFDVTEPQLALPKTNVF